MRNGARGETLAFVLLAQNDRNQHQSTLKRIKDCYVHNRGSFWITKKGIHLLRHVEPCDIWDTFEFLNRLGYVLDGVPRNRVLQTYTHPNLDNPVWKKIQFVDRAKFKNGLGRTVTKRDIIRECRDASS